MAPLAFHSLVTNALQQNIENQRTPKILILSVNMSLKKLVFRLDNTDSTNS